MSEENLEIQLEELESLEDMYPNQIKVLSRKSPISFSLTIDSNDYTRNKDRNSKVIRLVVNYGDEYPEDGPCEIKVESVKLVPNSIIKELQEIVDKQSEEMEGEPYVLDVIEAIVDYIQTYVGQKAMSASLEITKEEADRERELAEEIKLLDRVKKGTPVTKESYDKWAFEFYGELEEQKRDDKERRKESRGETGFEIWTRGVNEKETESNESPVKEEI